MSISRKARAAFYARWLLLLALGAILGCQKPPPDLVLGAKRLRAGDEAGAAAAFDRLIAALPSDGQAHVQVAAQCQLARNWSMTARYAGMGLALTSTQPDVRYALYSLLAGARMNTGDWDGAVEGYRAALQLRPRDPMAMNNLGYAYAQHPSDTRHLAEAERLTTDAVTLAQQGGMPPGQLAVLLDSVGWVQFKQGKLDEALSNLAEAAEAPVPEGEDPSVQAEVFYHLGRVYEAKGRLDEAAIALRRALKTDPGHALSSAALDDVVKLKALQSATPQASPPASPREGAAVTR